MTYVVTENCIRCKYMDCVEVCPVDCFYVGENMLVIHPDECIDCGVCEPECPAEAILPDSDDRASDWRNRTALFPFVAQYHPQGRGAGRCRGMEWQAGQGGPALRLLHVGGHAVPAQGDLLSLEELDRICAAFIRRAPARSASPAASRWYGAT